MKKEIITEKSIKELVELVNDDKLSEVVIENEIDKIQYIISKVNSMNGVNIYISPMKEPIKKPKYAYWEGNPDENLDKALDYMENPYPKVTNEILEQYKLFLKAEYIRLEAFLNVFRSDLENDRKIFAKLRDSNEKDELENKIGRKSLEQNRIIKKISRIKKYLEEK